MRLLVAQALLGLAVVIDNGKGLLGLPLVLLAVVLVAREVAGGGSSRAASRRALLLALVAQGATGLIRDPGDGLPQGLPQLGYRLLVASVVAVPAVVLWRPRFAGPAALAATCGVYLASAVLVLRSAPPPPIDVYTVQQEGAAALLSGKNPYAETFRNPYGADDTLRFFGDRREALDAYPYPPFSLLAGTLSFALAGDVRWSFLAAQLGAALLLYALARRGGQGKAPSLALAALLLAHPRGTYVLQKAWTEPLLCAAFLLALLWLRRGPLRPGSGLATGLFLAAKQHAVLAAPLLARVRSGGLPAWSWAIGVALVPTLPFFLWGPKEFIDDVLLFQLRQPFRPDALALPALVFRLTGWQAPGALAVIAALGVLSWSWRKLPASPHGAVLGAALVFAAFFLAAKQAFCNYWYWVCALLLISAATAPPARRDASPIFTSIG